MASQEREFGVVIAFSKWTELRWLVLVGWLGPCHRRAGRAALASAGRAVQLAREHVTVCVASGCPRPGRPRRRLADELASRGGAGVGGQDPVELPAGADAELGEDLAPCAR